MDPRLDELLATPGVAPVAIIVGSIVAAYLVEFVFRKTLVAVAKRTETELDDMVVDALHHPVFLTVVLAGLGLATGRIGLSEGGQRFVFGSLKTVGILIWTGAILRVASAVLRALSRQAHRSTIVQPRTVPVFDMLAKVATIGGAIYFVFLAWEIDLTAWLASAGIVGIAVGFAAKDTLANFFSGIFIVADAPYKVGDWIVLDNQLRGKVTNIGLRSTRILTRDDVEITIPNAVIGNSKIVNEAGGPHVKQRIAIKVDVAYGSDVDRTREVLLGCTEGVEHVCIVPNPQIRFRAFGGSGLAFELLVWIDDPGVRGLVIDDLNTRVYKALGDAGIEIPYSKHDIYIKEGPPGLG